MLSGPVELLFLVDLMASCTCVVDSRKGSSSFWFGLSFLVLLFMMRLTLFVLCGVEFMNCLLKACAMFFAVDLSLLYNCIVRFGCGVVVFPARWFIVFQYVCVFDL